MKIVSFILYIHLISTTSWNNVCRTAGQNAQNFQSRNMHFKKTDFFLEHKTDLSLSKYNLFEIVLLNNNMSFHVENCIPYGCKSFPFL